MAIDKYAVLAKKMECLGDFFEGVVENIVSIVNSVSSLTEYFFGMADYEDGEDPSMDFRIQFLEGDWTVLTGDPQFDTDHRGYWGYGSISLSNKGDEAVVESAVFEAIEEAIDSCFEKGEEV